MKQNGHINIYLIKGSSSEYNIKDDNNIFIGKFNIIELDKKNKRCTVRLKFYKDNKYELLDDTVRSILRAIFKDINIYKANILVEERVNCKVFLDLGFTLEGIITENVFYEGIFIDELSFGINRNEYAITQRNQMIELEGKRITLRNITPDYANELLDYYLRNKEHLMEYEPTRDSKFYTYEAQKTALIEGYKQLMNGTGVEFGIYKDEKLIGRIRISNIVQGVFKSATLGYSMDKDFEGNGYMKEAVNLVLEYAKEELELHRIEASVLTNNEKSKSVLLGCDFKEVGLNEKYLFINGSWRDHITFFKIL